MKKLLVLILIIVMAFTSVLPTYATDTNTGNKDVDITIETVYKSIDAESGKQEQLDNIDGKKHFAYFLNENNNVVSFYVSNNNLVDYAVKDNQGNLYTLNKNELKLKTFGIDTKLNFSEMNTNELLENMKKIKSYMDVNKDLLILVGNIAPSVSEEYINNEEQVSTKTLFSPVSAITSDIHSLGYNEYSNKLVASIPYHGVPGAVRENASIISISKENLFFAAFDTKVAIVSASVGLATGDLLSVGVWLYDYYEGYKTLRAQAFENWKSQWVGAKWVTFYNQGNYWQAEKSARFTTAVGENGVLTNSPTVSADSYYDNNAKLIEYGYIFNYE